MANCANLMNSPQSRPRQHATVETHAIHILLYALHRVLHRIIAIPLAVEETPKSLHQKNAPLHTNPNWISSPLPCALSCATPHGTIV